MYTVSAILWFIVAMSSVDATRFWTETIIYLSDCREWEHVRWHRCCRQCVHSISSDIVCYKTTDQISTCAFYDSTNMWKHVFTITPYINISWTKLHTKYISNIPQSFKCVKWWDFKTMLISIDRRSIMFCGTFIHSTNNDTLATTAERLLINSLPVLRIYKKSSTRLHAVSWHFAQLYETE